MAKNSQARIDANTRYNKKAYDNISIRVQKNMYMPAIIEAASQKVGISKAAYIQGAIIDRLHRDGFSVPGSDTAEGSHAERLTGGSIQE